MSDRQDEGGAAAGMGSDPLVDEVRAHREAIAEEVNHDLDVLYARLKRLEDDERSKGRAILPDPQSSSVPR